MICDLNIDDKFIPFHRILSVFLEIIQMIDRLYSIMHAEFHLKDDEPLTGVGLAAPP